MWIHLQLIISKPTPLEQRSVPVLSAKANLHCVQVGDPLEAKAIFNAYCNNRDESNPLHIGLLKSSIGHAEGASGLSSMTKVLISYENERISKNLHLDNLKSTIKPYCPPMLPITENLEYTPGLYYLSVRYKL